MSNKEIPTEELNKLHKSGAISDEEYELLKTQNKKETKKTPISVTTQRKNSLHSSENREIFYKNHNITLNPVKIQEGGKKINSAAAAFMVYIILSTIAIISTMFSLEDFIRGNFSSGAAFLSLLLWIGTIISLIIFIAHLSVAGVKFTSSPFKYSPEKRDAFKFMTKIKKYDTIGKQIKGGIIAMSDKREKNFLILSTIDIGSSLTFKEAEQLSNMQININGYTDWFIPNKEEMQIVFEYLVKTDKSNDLTGRYWLSNGPFLSRQESLYHNPIEKKEGGEKHLVFDFDTGEIEEQHAEIQGKLRLMRIDY